MGLQGADGVVVRHRAFDGAGQGARLLGTESEDHDLLGGVDGGDAHGERLGRNGLGISAEEAGIDLTGVLGQRHDAGAGLQRGERLVEGDVAVFADTAHEQVDAAGLDDGLLIGGALGGEVGGVAVEDVDVLLGLVDMVEQVLVHEGVVALGMLHGKADILVHVEGNDVLEGQLTGLDHAHEFGVGVQRGGTGGEAQHEGLVGTGGLLLDLGGDIVGSPEAAVLGIVADDDFHDISRVLRILRWPGIPPCPARRRVWRCSRCALRRAARTRADPRPGTGRCPSARGGGRWRGAS